MRFKDGLFRYNEGMGRDNETWLADLHSENNRREKAVNDLREILIKILPKALSRWLSPTDPHFDGFLQDIAQETLIRVLERLDTFEGRSKFTTWVYTIAIRIALSELRLKKWKEISLDELETSKMPDQMPHPRFEAQKPDPETAIERKNALKRVLETLKEELTPHQQAVMTAVIFKGIPMDVVAERMGTNRNALYKVMHDARVKLKRKLEQQGVSPEELLKIVSN